MANRPTQEVFVPRQRPARITVALLVGAFVLLGIGAALLVPDSPRLSGNQRSGGETGLSTAPPPLAGQPDHSGGLTQPASDAASNPDVAMDLESVPPEPKNFWIVFVAEGDLRISGVRARVTVVSSTRLPNGHFEEKGLDAESDASGQLLVAALPGNTVRVQLDDDNWGALPVQFVCRAEDAAAEKFIRLHPLCTVAVRARFDDGEPVTSSGGFLSLGVLNTFDLDEAGYAKVRRVLQSEGVTCTVYSGYRAGYARHEVPVSAHELKTGSEILIIVPKSAEPFGLIRLLFDDPTLSSSRVIIECSISGPQESSIRQGVRSWDSPKLLSGLEYRITLLGDLAWQSPWVGVPSGATTDLRAFPVASASVRATLLTESGAPLPGGTVKLHDGGAVSYGPRNVPRLPAAMLSNQAGEIVLRGLPPGSHIIEFHAWGRSTVQVSVVVTSGETVELGPIILDPALGSIRVSLVGAQEGKSYDVYLTDINAAILAPAVRTAQQDVSFERLTLHKYVVSVTLAGGGLVASADAFLDESNTSAAVQIDVSQLKP